MSIIARQDTNGVKPLLQTGELGYDNYPAGGDKGRVWVGTGTTNIALAKKVEVTVVDDKANMHIARVDNPHGVTATQVGLGNVDNTSDANKPISTATQDALNLKANAANAVLTGIPTAPTASVGTNTTQLATTAFVNSAITDSAPTKTGTGASGTWEISITGNAATATTATNVSGGKATVYGTGNDYHLGGVEVLGNGAANTVFPTIGFNQPSLYASSLQLRGSGDFRFYTKGGKSYANVTANTFTGKLSGNADTATRLSTTRGNYKTSTDSVVVGELMWKNYGNEHTIFDASNSTTPIGTATDNTNPGIAWGPTLPTLMGFDGHNTYGVRVDSSRYADQLKTARTVNGVSFDGTADIVVPTNLTVGTRTATEVPIESSSGTNASIPAATTALAGVMSSADKVKLDGIAAGAQVNVPTNLAITAGTTAGPIITSSTGTNATLPTATASASGVVTTGNQTWAGVKTFSSNPISTATQSTVVGALTRKDYVDTALDSKANKSTTYTKTEIDKMLADGGNDVYIGSYGLEWNETTDTYRRIGAVNYTAIQSLMRRCVLNSDGSVNYYLDKNNSNLKEDGTLAKLDGTDGNVMVEVPKTFIRYTYTTTGGAGTDTVHRWEISLTPDTGFEVHWAFDRGGSIRDKRYYPAYQGYVTGGKMISRSGVYPTTAQTLAQFRTAARANSIGSPSTGYTANGYWGQIDFALYELITMYMVIEYGTMNIQSALGEGRTRLSGGTWVGGELIGVTGLSNSYGNRTTNYTYVGASTDANADLSFMSYRGCENFFGNVWRMADGVIFKGTTGDKTMWYSTNPANYNETASGYTNSGIVTAAADGYGRKLANTNKGFIVTDVTGGNSNTGTTDYYYTSTTDNTLALVGGDSANGLSTGPLNLTVYHSAASLSNAAVGCGVSF